MLRYTVVFQNPWMENSSRRSFPPRSEGAISVVTKHALLSQISPPPRSTTTSVWLCLPRPPTAYSPIPQQGCCALLWEKHWPSFLSHLTSALHYQQLKPCEPNRVWRLDLGQNCLLCFLVPPTPHFSYILCDPSVREECHLTTQCHRITYEHSNSSILAGTRHQKAVSLPLFLLLLSLLP